MTCGSVYGVTPEFLPVQGVHPRLRTTGGVPGARRRTVPVPWVRPGSGFTLLFEAMVVELAKSQPVADIAEQVG